jgi:ferrous iron transport protein A
MKKGGDEIMSPLALLQEGEAAEIIDMGGNDGNAHRGRHQHCHRGQRCENSWAISSCSRIGRDGLRSSHSHLHDMGLHPGKKVEMISNSGAGPLILRVDECRIAIGRGAAMKIYVRRSGE